MDNKKLAGILETIETKNMAIPTKHRGNSMTVTLPDKATIDQLITKCVGKVISLDQLKALFDVKGYEGKSDNSLINNVNYLVNNELEKNGWARILGQRNMGTKDQPKLIAVIKRV